MPGSGPIVQETLVGVVVPGAPVDLVTQRFADTLAFAETWATNAQNAMNTLEGYITQFQMPSNWQDALNNVTIPTINGIDPSAFSFLGSLTLPDNWPTNFPTLPTLASPPPIDLSYDTPIAPDSNINPTINYQPAPFSSDIYLQVLQAIYNDIQSQGWTLTAEIETAVVDRRREEQRLINARKYQADMRAAGATGFNFAGGVVAGIMTDSTTEILHQDTDFNNNVLIQSFDMANKNRTFSLEKGLDIEKILRDFYQKMEDRNLEAQKATGQLVVSVLAEQVRAYTAEWDGVKTELSAKTEQLDLVIKSNQLLVDAFKAQADGFVSQVNAVKAETEGLVAGYTGQVEAFKAQVEEQAAYYNVITEIAKVQLGVGQLQLEKATTEVKTLLESQLSFDKLKESISETMGHLAQQAVASALNAVSAHASYGYTGSEERSEHWTHGDQLTESDTYEHDPTS